MDPASILLVLLLVVAGVVVYALVAGGGMFRSGKADPGGDEDGPRPTHTVVRDESESGRAHGPGH